MAEIENGTDLEQPADDIRSTLAAAIAESEAPAEVAAEKSAAASDTGADATGAKPERVRGPDGKFLKKEEGDGVDPAAAIAAKPDAPAVDPNAAPPIADSKEPPAHWSQTDKDKFKAQAPETQAFILDRCDHDLRHDSAVFLLISKNRSVAASISISGLELAQNQGANLKSLADDRFARALRLLKSEENDG